MSFRIISLGINSEEDVVAIRQRARQLSALLGFASQDQVRIATAVSEVSRTACAYTIGGRVDFFVCQSETASAFEINIKSAGGALRESVQNNTLDYSHNTALDDALVSAHRLMDSCVVDSEAGKATVITLRKNLSSADKISADEVNKIIARISASPVANTYAEVQLQNKELLDTLAELRARQDDLLALTQELEDTNRGVVALYAEVEEKAERLRQADEMKSRFLSNTSHELRTPLSSMRALLQILLSRTDGDLTPEQEKQILLVQKSATDLSELVNDLLDLAKIESGKTAVICSAFLVSDLFSALRGMLRPLSDAAVVDLIFEDPPEGLEMVSDEGKVSQILRNFISNALKFTEQGSVTVAADYDKANGKICFSVTDTGLGIAPQDQQFVFEEFTQIPNRLQGRSKGTGLGLPLCRKLATVLGGQVTLKSELNTGSTFVLVLPIRYIDC